MSRPGERALAAAAAWIEADPDRVRRLVEHRGARFAAYCDRDLIVTKADPRYRPATQAALEQLYIQRYQPRHPDWYLMATIKDRDDAPVIVVHAPGQLPWKRVLVAIRRVLSESVKQSVRWDDLFVYGLDESTSERPRAWQTMLNAPPRGYALFEVARDESYRCVKKAGKE